MVNTVMEVMCMICLVAFFVLEQVLVDLSVLDAMALAVMFVVVTIFVSMMLTVIMVVVLVSVRTRM